MAKSKVTTIPEVIQEHCFEGMTILIAGFVGAGGSESLIDGLLESGIGNLNVICNDTCRKGVGIGKLVHAGRIKRITCSHIGLNSETCEKTVAGEIDITLVPQGSLAEKVRAGGAGIGGILTPTGVHTPVEEGKQLLEWDEETRQFKLVTSDMPQAGQRYILELPLRGDVAFIHAWKADKAGNLIYRRTSRNFNEVFATAADYVIVEAEEIVEVGELDPDEIMTPSIVVDAVVQGRAPAKE